MKSYSAILILIFSLLLNLTGILSLYAQTKQEKESRIKAAEAPQFARDFVKPAAEQSAIRWYYEKNLEGNSFEAKFQLGDRKFSIEFDTTGILQDVEIEIRATEIPAGVHKNIQFTLDSSFSKFKIRKIQEQYLGPPDQLTKLFEYHKHPDTVSQPSYELVIKGRKNRDVNLYEYTFSSEGKLMSSEKIILNRIDNLAY